MKKIYPILLIVVLAALAVGVTYWRGKSQSALPSEPPVADAQNQVIEQPTSNEVTDTAPVSTAGWKTYKNKENNYEFKYPSDWFVKDGSEFHKDYNTGEVIFITPKSISGFADLDNIKYFNIFIYDNSKSLEPENWILNEYTKGEVAAENPSISKMTIGNNNVEKFTADNYPPTSYFIFNNKKVLDFLVGYKYSNDPLLLSIIASLKFLK